MYKLNIAHFALKKCFIVGENSTIMKSNLFNSLFTDVDSNAEM